MKRIFAPFFITHTEGTGLGLSITRLMIEAHGGEISVKPLSPFGTAFSIRLPYDGGETGWREA
jgi:signal transduction histidine kinase